MPNQQKTIDSLNMDHWVYALATQETNIYKRSRHSIIFNLLKGLTRSVSYHHFPYYGTSSRSGVQVVLGVQQLLVYLYDEKNY